MPKAKPTSRTVSKAQVTRDERRWQAEHMVMEGMRDTAEFKAAVKVAKRHLELGEKAARQAIKGKKG